MDTPKTIDELDEMRARALYANHPAGFWLKQPTAFDDLPAEVRRDVLTEARIIREADKRVGLALIPVKHDSRKHPMIGEYKFTIPDVDEDGEECEREITVPWDVTKEIVSGAIAASPFAEHAMERLQQIVDQARARGEEVLDQYGYLSTGEMISVCLAVGTPEALDRMPSSYRGYIKDAWNRIDDRHRAFILENWRN